MAHDPSSLLAQAGNWLMHIPGDANLFWISVTLIAYASTMALYRRSRAHPLMLPVVTGTAMVVALLVATDTPYPHYLSAVSPLVFMIGPATVALAVPLFGQVPRLKTLWRPVMVALLAGCVVAMGSAWLIAWVFGGNAQTLISLVPKSSTMPIATSLSQHFGGLVPLAAAAVALTGISATVLSGPVLRWFFGPLDDAAHGFALGLSAHAIGTARALQISETAGAFAAMAMSLNGLMTALLMPLVAAGIAAYR